MRGRAGSACVRRRWAAVSVIRSAPATLWWKFPSITAPQPDRVAAAAAEAQASKGVKGAVRKARKALEQRNKQGQKKKK